MRDILTLGLLSTLPGVGPLPRWLLQLRNDSPARRPTYLEHDVVLGGEPSSATWQALRAAGANRAICLVGEAPPRPLPGAVEVLWLPVRDRDAPEPEQLASGCAFLNRGRAQGARTFIYCWSGQGRSPTLYLAWRLSVPGTSLEVEESRLRRLRPLVALAETQRSALGRWMEARPSPG